MGTFAKLPGRHLPIRAASPRKARAAKRTPGTECEEPLAAIAHDARNVVAALLLCCDLLAKPGVLAEGHENFANELQAVASASSGLVEQLTALGAGGRLRARRAAKSPARSMYIEDLAAAVQQLRRPLAALAGAKTDLQVESLFCAGRVPLSQEGLTRILINLTRNAAEAMPQGGRIRITVQLGDGGSFLDSPRSRRSVVLCVEDSGPGIPEELMERIFDAGVTSKTPNAAWMESPQRGLGLNIVRRLAEAAGGTVRARSAPGGGARFEVELPLIHPRDAKSGFIADFPERANIEC